MDHSAFEASGTTPQSKSSGMRQYVGWAVSDISRIKVPLKHWEPHPNQSFLGCDYVGWTVSDISRIKVPLKHREPHPNQPSDMFQKT